MAIQRVDGYVYSCAGCGAVYPKRGRRGWALDDEVHHHRQWDGMECICPDIDDHRHHRTDCVAWHLHQMAERNARPPGTDTS